MVRIIHYIKDNSERIYITEDLETDASEFSDWSVESDEQHDIDLPGTFPLETLFEKVL